MSTAALLILSTAVRGATPTHRGPAPARMPGRAWWRVACASHRPMTPNHGDRAVAVRSGSPFTGSNRPRDGASPGSPVGADAGRHSLGIRAGLRLLLPLLLLLPPHDANAQGAPPSDAPAPAPSGQDAPRIGGDPRPGGPCVVVDIAGHKAGHLDCASAALAAAARSAQARARAGFDAPVADARSPDVVTGVANQTATRQRMGNAFGVSVHPQRPHGVPLPPRGSQP